MPLNKYYFYMGEEDNNFIKLKLALAVGVKEGTKKYKTQLLLSRSLVKRGKTHRHLKSHARQHEKLKWGQR